jgi:hypothetical protein
MKCTIHDDFKMSEPHEICRDCRIESHKIMKDMTRRNELPKWILENHSCPICDNLNII